MKNSLHVVFALGFLVASALALGACNTVEGFGQDLQKAGQSLERTAE